MGRAWAVGLALAAVLCVALAGCAPKGAAAVSPSVNSTAALMIPAPLSTASAPAIATPSPSPTPAPAPTATPQPWTPGPLATADEMAYDAAAQGMFYDNFLVVQRNGLQGLVGADGHVILPCDYASVKPITYHSTDYYPGEHAFPTHKELLFFVAPPQVTVKPYDDIALGWICDSQGHRRNDELFEHVYFIGSRVLWAWKHNDDAQQTMQSVVLADNGKVLFQGQYNMVVMIEDRIYACSDVRQITDVYDNRGRKLRTMPEIVGDMVSVGNGKYLKTLSSQGDDPLETLWDRNMKALFTVDYGIDWLCDNRFRAVIDRGTGVVDITGKPIVPPNYDEIELVRDGGKDYLCAQGHAGCGLYDLDGKVLYQSQDDTSLTLADGRLIVRSGDGDAFTGRALGLDGQDLLSRKDVLGWLPEVRLYHCGDINGNDIFVRENGTELPLPKAPYIVALSADRFLVMLSDGRAGLFDSTGKEIIPAAGNLQESGLPGVLIYYGMDHGRAVQWLVDDYGSRLWDQMMDTIQYTGKKDLFEVHLGAKYGLRKLDGSWIWSASDYQELQD